MQTIKTAVVVVLLLGVCYGAYVALNAPEPTLPESLQDWNEDAMALDVENGAAVDIPQLSQTPPPDALDSLAPPSVAPPSVAQTVVPPPLVGPTTPSLSLPNTPPSISSNLPSKTPDVLVPPTKFDNKSGVDSKDGLGKDGLGNDVLGLPDLALPRAQEGDSVPLPNLSEPDSSLPPSPALMTNTTFPSLPGAENSTAAEPDVSAHDASASPGLLTITGNNGMPPSPNALQSNATGISASGITKSDKGKSPGSTAQPFSLAREQALKLANEGKLRDALALMTPYFNHIELTRQEHLDLKDLLDALAGEVIYSRRHLLESKFIVSPGDTLESIANKYRVSPEVLANINRMGDSRVVLAGTELKVFYGPFRAEVAHGAEELTLFLGELYAGRFPVSINKQLAPEGSYSIVERRRDQAYVGPDSKYIAANDGRNPYGGFWMNLGNNICIHGSPATSSPETESSGCIGLAPLDAKEVYSLLTQGAEVVIKQ